MNHTKEPWRVHLLDRRTMIASDVDNGYLAETRHIHSGDIEQANAQRIVDCVNACAGITSEALQAGYIKHLVEWDKVNHDCLDKVDSKETPFEFKGKKILEDK